MSERKDFCISCRKNTNVILQKKKITKTIKDKEYDFMITAAVCEECLCLSERSVGRSDI